MMKMRSKAVCIIAFMLVILTAFNSFAAVGTKVFISDAFSDDPENHIPDEEITDEGKKYILKEYKLEDAEVEADAQYVSKTVDLGVLAPYQSAPGLLEVPVENQFGEEFEASIPLVDEEYTDERWEDGLEFIVTVHDWGADAYMANGQEIEVDEDEPLKGYENEVLQLAGLDSDNYRITDLKWASEPYMSGGVPVRDIKATGDMLVTDCIATYAGEVRIPGQPAHQIRAVYELAEEETEPETEEETEPELINEPAQEEREKSFWERLRDLWFNSDLRKWLNQFGFGKAIVKAVDWALEDETRTQITAAGLGLVMFFCWILFISAFGRRKKKAR